MKASKHTITIKVETVSLDSIPAVLMEVIKGIGDGFLDGYCMHHDREVVTAVDWSTDVQEV